MKKIREKMRQVKEKFHAKKENAKNMVKYLAIKTMMALGCVMCMCMGTVIQVNAGFQGMEGVARSLSTQIMWVGIVIVAGICISFLAKRNWVQAVVIFIVGAGICVLVGNLDMLKSIGDWGVKTVIGMDAG